MKSILVGAYLKYSEIFIYEAILFHNLYAFPFSLFCIPFKSWKPAVNFDSSFMNENKSIRIVSIRVAQLYRSPSVVVLASTLLHLSPVSLGRRRAVYGALTVQTMAPNCARQRWSGNCPPSSMWTTSALTLVELIAHKTRRCRYRASARPGQRQYRRRRRRYVVLRPASPFSDQVYDGAAAGGPQWMEPGWHSSALAPRRPPEVTDSVASVTCSDCRRRNVLIECCAPTLPINTTLPSPPDRTSSENR